MEKAVTISRDFGYIKIPESSIIPTSDIKQFKNNEILIICTGSQGEPMAALSRIAGGEHKDVHIQPGDTVVFSSSPIPGNGIMIDHVVNLLSRAGAEVVTNTMLSDIHSSGHPSREELKLVLKLFNPKYFMPMHGEYRMLRLHAELAQSLGMEEDHTFILNNGDSLTLSRHKVSRGYPVEHGSTYIDGKDINGLADAVMEDRRILTDDGMLAITLSIDSKKNEIVVEPNFWGMGLVQENDSEMYHELKKLLTKAIKEKLQTRTSFSEHKIIIKQIAGDYIYKQTRRKPMIIPVIMSKNS